MWMKIFGKCLHPEDMENFPDGRVPALACRQEVHEGIRHAQELANCKEGLGAAKLNSPINVAGSQSSICYPGIAFDFCNGLGRDGTPPKAGVRKPPADEDTDKPPTRYLMRSARSALNTTIDFISSTHPPRKPMVPNKKSRTSGSPCKPNHETIAIKTPTTRPTLLAAQPRIPWPPIQGWWCNGARPWYHTPAVLYHPCAEGPTREEHEKPAHHENYGMPQREEPLRPQGPGP
ncbi:hypothetical protein BS47DRAFT_1367933 [Hydnum rufescens UP504]|uniref:Uncharacterized protein n=1 Tax=Hydnum rufescens UP504 TaxID=1448309 RepID=A0A9P6AGZ4_9AGAM|nr:hypothetical protein BS47DRAFT_1367933 [Hydnum rufescens UP504]